MPFQSEKQRRFLHANHPEIAKRWESDYANGGISNHFRRKFFTGALADTQGPAGGQAMSPGTSTSGGTRHGGGGGNGGHTNNNTPPTHPIHTGPTATEIAATKAAAEAKAAAEKKAIADAQYKNWWDATKEKKKEKVKHQKKLTSKFDIPEWDETDYGLTFADLGIDKFSTDENIKLAKVFNTKKELQSIGAAKPSDFWDTLTDQGEALEEFRKNATSMNQGDYYKGLGVQSQFNQLLENKNKNATENKDFIQKAINEGFLKDKSDFVNQKPLDDAVDLKAKGGVARKNYFHGGILDINESEEIISDDGNDIELTAYNAAFDEPTGVKSLFKAKDGGTPRRSYFTGAYGVGGTENTGSTSSGNGGYQNVHQTGAVTQTPGRTTSTSIGPSLHGGPTFKNIKDVVETGPGSDWEKYDTDLEGMSDAEKYIARRNMIKSKYTGTSKQRKNSLDTNYQTEKARLQKKITTDLIKKGIFFWAGGGFDIKDFVGIDWKNKKIDITGVLGDVMDLDKLKKTHINDLEDIKDSLLVDVDTFNPNEMANLDDTVFPDLMKDLKDLYKTRDPDDIERNEFIYKPLTGEVGEEYAQGKGDPFDRINWMDQIREKQALREITQPDWQLTAEERELKNNPIVMTGNSGGLANLFRVKNQ